MNSPLRFCRTTATAALLLWIAAASAEASVLITEVIPNVLTTATSGDVVEIYNTGPGSVDLTDWILTDLDNDPIAGVLQDATFAPALLAVDPLEAGEFAVIHFVDIAGTASWQTTNYGLAIVAPLEAGSFLGSERDELVLADAAQNLIDSVAWADTNTVVTTDSYEDLSALTGVVSDYGLVVGDAAWSGDENIASDGDYYASAVDFTAFSAVSTHGDGAIRRRSVNGVFDVASPDGAAQWEAVPRHQATLGNPSDDVSSGPGLRPIRMTGDLTSWLGQIETTTFPDRRIARFADQNPADFLVASDPELADWQAVFALAMNGQWEEAFGDGDLLGYEVVEFLDTVSGETFHLLRERFVPGEVGFTGRGVFAFFEGADVQSDLVIEIPHPIFDADTLEEGALALVEVRPRVLAIAGTHRNNALTLTTCDGTFSGGAKYRISDVAHHPGNFFHASHRWLESNLPGSRSVQLHGFCCPGVFPYDALTDDCVISTGIDAPTSPTNFAQIWRDRIDGQMFLADGVDQTTAAVFGDDAAVLGATTNLQGRISNGVAPGAECDTEAVSVSGRFFHIEQDPDVREEPLHILTALLEALTIVETVPSSCAETPAIGCRSAAAGKSKFDIADKDGTTKDSLKWKWSKGEETTLDDLSDAVLGAAAYHFCVYDASVSPQPLIDSGVSAGGDCGGKSCWKALGTKGYSYKDKLGFAGGITGLKLKSGIAGKAQIQTKAKGDGLLLPTLPLTGPVVVQLLIDNGSTVECWQTSFTDPPLKNEATQFKAKQ